MPSNRVFTPALCALTALLSACEGSDAAESDAGGGGLAGGAGGGESGSTGGTAPLPAVDGRAYYTFGDEVFRIAAADGAVPENVSAALAAVAPGARDRFGTASATGDWLVMSSERGGCGGECLVRVPADLSAVEPVMAGGAEVYVEGISAIDAAGERVVFSPKGGGPHTVDLYLTTREGAGWSAPVLLTGDSTYDYNNMPALNRAGTHVLFDCGANPYPEDGGNDACEVALDGTGFRKLVGPDTLPGARYAKVQNPHPGPDGVLFESSWPIEGGDAPELIWLLPAAGGEPTPIGAKFPNAVSPCALADGRFVMLWLGREGNREGKHELTLVSRDGELISVLTPDLDVADIGLGCSD